MILSFQRFLSKLGFFALFFLCVRAHALDVVFLTQEGPGAQTRVLKSWTSDELNQLSKKKSSISAQDLIINETAAKTLPLTDLADVDLITLYGEKSVARVPRFLVWRGLLKLQWNKSTKTLDARGEIEKLVPSRLLIPAEILRVKNIQKIELAQHSWVYPGTRLSIRTNPAASRGEKLFTQSCLACHSLPGAKAITPKQLTHEALLGFSSQHKAYPVLSLDARAVRGLEAYRDALVIEKPVVKSAP